MRWLLFSAALVVIAVASIASGVAPLTMTDNALLSRIRPCSYSDSTKGTIAATGASASTGPFTRGRNVRFVCDTAVHRRMSATSPTAVATDSLLPANTIEIFLSEADYIGVIRDASSGTCYYEVCR